MIAIIAFTIADTFYDFSLAKGGFTTSGNVLWTHTGGQWQTTDTHASRSYLTSPDLLVTDPTVRANVIPEPTAGLLLMARSLAALAARAAR